VPVAAPVLLFAVPVPVVVPVPVPAAVEAPPVE
jgi:hypothetical protein